MNSVSKLEDSAIGRAFSKARVSQDLREDFLQFLAEYPDYFSQALYLLENKKLSIEKVILDLYEVPIKEQANWCKPKEKLEKVGEVPNFFHAPVAQYQEINPKLLYKEWKQEHGFDSNPLEIGDVHTFIRFEKIASFGRVPKFKWVFCRARYGKGGWGHERPLRSILKSLLDNNSNPGWVVRSFLEENQNLCDEEGIARPQEEIPNPFLLNAFDSHELLKLLMGHPYLYYGQSSTPIQNFFAEASILFHRHTTEESYFLIGYGEFALDEGGKVVILAADLLAEGIFFPQAPAGLVFNHRYYRLAAQSVPTKMLLDSLHGVVIPKSQWEGFLALWPESYGSFHFIDQPPTENYSPDLISRNIKFWQNWLLFPEQTWFEQHHWQRPLLHLAPESKHCQSNRISFYVEGFEEAKAQLLSPEKVPQHAKLYAMIEKALEQQKGASEPNLITFERYESSLFLNLLENYDLAFNAQGEPLFAKMPLVFSLTVKKHPENLSQYCLQGDILVANEAQTPAQSADQKGPEVSIAVTPTMADGPENVGRAFGWQGSSHPNAAGGADIQGLNDLKSEGRKLEKVRAIGLVPAYIFYNNHLVKIGRMHSARMINDSLVGVIVEEQEIGDFYAVALPFLRQREVSLSDPQGLLRVSALYNYKIRGYMTIWEIGGILMGRLACSMSTDIGEFDYPLGTNFEEFTKKLDERRYQIPRSKAQETAVMEAIYSHGWIEEGAGEYSMNEQNAAKFVLDVLPFQGEQSLVVYLGQKKLKKWKVRMIQPTFSTNIKTGIDWFDVGVKVEFEGKEIALSQIIDLWKLGQVNIKMPGDEGIVVIDQKWIEKFAPLLSCLVESNQNRQKGLEKGTNQDLLRVDKFQIGLLSELEEAAQDTRSDLDWKSLVHSIKNHQGIPKVVIPSSIKAQLRDYQREGVEWLLYLRRMGFCGILADDMGLGKTLQTLAFITIDRETAKQKPVLVIAPTSVIFNWQEETKKFVPHFKIFISYGPKRKEGMQNLNAYDIIVTSYNLLQKDLELFRQYSYSIIVLDEAQMIKNSRSKNAQAVIDLQSDYRLSLTGTPVENSVLELWSQFNFLMPGLLGNLKEFQRATLSNYHRVSEKKVNDFSFIRRQTKPFILRRMKQSVATELPQKIEQTLFCEMYDEQRKIYNTVLEVVKRDLKQKIRNKTIYHSRIAIFDAMLKLRQICCDPRLNKLSGEHPPECSKLNLFLETLNEIVEEGHRVLVFSQFVKMLELMHLPLKERGINFLQLDGGVQNRQELVHKFQTNDAFPVFLISLKAGGVGINLTEADYVIHYDPWWNPAVEAQATDRAYRIGQKNHVHVYKLITSNSIEEKIQDLQKKKKFLADQLVQSSKNIEELFEMEDFEEIFDL